MRNRILLTNGQSLNDSTLLIPAHLRELFDRKVNVYGGVCKMFNFVVNSRHPILNIRPAPDTGKTCYSPSGQNLQRVNFRPRNEDWERFRIIANSRRVSMSFLFVMLLMNWEEFETCDSGVPALPTKIALLISLTRGPALTRIQLCRHRI